MRGMRALRSFKPDRCYQLISRIANRAFYLTDEERTRFVAEGVACVFPVNLKEGERLQCGLDGRWRLHDRLGSACRKTGSTT